MDNDTEADVYIANNHSAEESIYLGTIAPDYMLGTKCLSSDKYPHSLAKTETNKTKSLNSTFSYLDTQFQAETW